MQEKRLNSEEAENYLKQNFNKTWKEVAESNEKELEESEVNSLLDKLE